MVVSNILIYILHMTLEAPYSGCCYQKHRSPWVTKYSRTSRNDRPILLQGLYLPLPHRRVIHSHTIFRILTSSYAPSRSVTYRYVSISTWPRRYFYDYG